MTLSHFKKIVGDECRVRITDAMVRQARLRGYLSPERTAHGWHRFGDADVGEMKKYLRERSRKVMAATPAA